MPKPTPVDQIEKIIRDLGPVQPVVQGMEALAGLGQDAMDTGNWLWRKARPYVGPVMKDAREGLGAIEQVLLSRIRGR